MISVKVDKKIKKSTKYPCLKIFKENLVVLFQAPQCGFVVYWLKMRAGAPQSSTWVIGYHSKTWLEEEFENFDGEIVLSNEGDDNG